MSKILIASCRLLHEPLHAQHFKSTRQNRVIVGMKFRAFVFPRVISIKPSQKAEWALQIHNRNARTQVAVAVILTEIFRCCIQFLVDRMTRLDNMGRLFCTALIDFVADGEYTSRKVYVAYSLMTVAIRALPTDFFPLDRLITI